MELAGRKCASEGLFRLTAVKKRICKKKLSKAIRRLEEIREPFLKGFILFLVEEQAIFKNQN